MILSVCVITYNHESFIRQTIESLLFQETNFFFEIIIGDDFSLDGTRRICEVYEYQYPSRIKLLFSKKNTGAISNLISTLNICSGKYIALCEGDDYWTDPHKLQKQVDFLENNPDYAMHCHNALITYEKNIIEPHLFNKEHLKETLCFSDIINNWNIPTASMVFRRSALPMLPDWFTNIYHGDYALGLLVSEKGKVKYSNEVMSVYRKQFGALSFNPAINSEFSVSKLITLFEHINSETEFRYKDLIYQRLINLHKRNKQLKIKRRYPFLYPTFLLKKILLKFGFSILRKQNKNCFNIKIINLRKLRKNGF